MLSNSGLHPWWPSIYILLLLLPICVAVWQAWEVRQVPLVQLQGKVGKLDILGKVGKLPRV
jgi:hypothetical protein